MLRLPRPSLFPILDVVVFVGVLAVGTAVLRVTTLGNRLVTAPPVAGE